MKWSNGYRMRLLLVGFMAAIVLGVRCVNADFVFGEPTNLGPNVNSGSSERGLSISSDGLSLFFDSDQPDHGDYDLYVATRETIEAPWEPSRNLGPIVNSPTTRNEAHPSISSDGLELFFSGQHWQPNATGYGESDLWVTRRVSLSDPWGAPENLGALVNTASDEAEPSISADGLSLYFMSNRSAGRGKLDIWVTTRPTINADWGVPTNLGAPVNSSGWECAPTISADSLVLFFQSDRPGGYGPSAAYPLDIWMTRRTSTSDPWGEPVNLGPNVNTSLRDAVACISPDGHTLYFSSWGWTPRIGHFDIWQAPIIPIVDFDGDGNVDATDMSIMIDHWGEDYSLCDIGPTPFGDGIVDVQDLIVLAEHLFEEVDDPTLVAHWALDEIEGIRARESVTGDDAYVLGDAIWQPDGGMVDGALELDGVDDCIITDFGLNPAEGPFSIFAWIKGGAPGQVIISQAGGDNWLCADAFEGNLVTELRYIGGRLTEPPLVSQTIITDNAWHRVALSWDGTNRILYVDDVEVAKDIQPGFASSEGGLYIGTGKDMELGTYWSGLIDEVRIYDRSVKP